MSREGGRAAARSIRPADVVELELDREPSLSFLDGLVRELRERGLLDRVTFVTQADLVRRHLGRFVAYDPTMEIWVRTSSGGRARVELPDDEPLEIEEGLIGDDVGLG
jgi:hypothetical protein